MNECTKTTAPLVAADYKIPHMSSCGSRRIASRRTVPFDPAKLTISRYEISVLQKMLGLAPIVLASTEMGSHCGTISVATTEAFSQ